ncbi:hypothetical protein [Pedobacter sandarakinus]|uniref:hypothetical protein n=1 Tax=Pedobacter sandarakinus TaxID=353156 RepID=UPI002246CA10|nr:hypothetical protein [Pedobacter sandarakinus]MCX2573468.1 hypothetical protein [Pedobacter sandarakinus]
MVRRIEFKQRRDFGQVINDTFTFIRQNLKQLITLYFLFCGLFVFLSMGAMLIQQYKLSGLITNSGSSIRYSGYQFANYGIEYYFSLLFSLLSYCSMTVVILSYISIYVQKGNEKPTIDEIWVAFKRYFFRTFWASIVLGILLLIGFVLCILPGFWLFPFIGMVFPIMVLEDERIGFAFNRSFVLIKNNFWITFATLLLIWIIVYACMSMIILPTTILGMVGIFSQKSTQLSLTFMMISTVLQSLCQSFTILPVITLALLYFNLTEQKEHHGLLERISDFGNIVKPVDSRPEEY